MVFDDEQIALLNSPLDPRLISTRSGGGGSSLKYIEGHDAIDQADRIFGYGKWAYRPLSCEQTVLFDPIDGTAVGVVYKAKVELIVAGSIAPIVEVGSQPVMTWNVLDTIMAKRKREDQDRPVQKWEEVNARRTIVDSHEMAEKGSVTDALKRCLRAYGNQFGNSLYGDGRVDLDSEPQPQPQQNYQPVPQPQDGEPATQSQLTAIRKMYEGLKRETAGDVDDLTYGQAKVRISDLGAALKEAKNLPQSRQESQQTPLPSKPDTMPVQQRSAAPAELQPVPLSEVDAVRARFSDAYQVSSNFEARWSAFKVHFLGRSFEDSDLNRPQLAKLTKSVKAREDQPSMPDKKKAS